MKKRVVSLVLAATTAMSMLAGCGSNSTAANGAASKPEVAEASSSGSKKEEKPFDGVTLTMMFGTDTEKAGLEKVLAMAEEDLGIHVDVEYVVGGTEGDNLLKTRLASGDAADIMQYNSGAKCQALNMKEYFYDIKNEDFVKKYDDGYVSTVNDKEGGIYGVPLSTTQAGAVVYNKKIYKDLGLEVPETWADFLANCDKIKKAGLTPIEATFGDSWTSQVPFLGDNYNVINKNPDFISEFEAGKAKFADTPEGVSSFQKYIDMKPYLNEDYLAATYNDGCEAIATGTAAHYIILTQALANMIDLYPEAAEDLGVFAIPAEKAEDTGLTTWYPMTFFINKNASNVDACVALMDYWVSDKALDAYVDACGANGPACIKGYTLPDTVIPAVRKDMQKYFDKGNVMPALEFMTPIKGNNCEQITVAVGSGQMTAEEAAAAYDDDCAKQAQQLGYDWK